VLPGRRDPQGRLDITADPPGVGTTYQGGIAINSLGQVHAVGADPTRYVNGLPVSDTGQLCVGDQATAYFLEGIPRTGTGRIKAQADNVPAATDPYIGGLRIGPLGGVYTTYVVPPVGDPPMVETYPDVTGDPQVGAILTCDGGVWISDTPVTLAYQWYQDSGTRVPIAGATASTYVAQAPDYQKAIRCEVTATNEAGGASGWSNMIIITIP
jgi:hypothetical protein